MQNYENNDYIDLLVLPFPNYTSLEVFKSNPSFHEWGSSSILTPSRAFYLFCAPRVHKSLRFKVDVHSRSICTYWVDFIPAHHKRLIFWEDKLLWIGKKYRCIKNKGFWLRGFQNFLYYLNKFWNLSNGTLGNASSINNATFVDFHCVSSGEATDLKKLFLFMLLFC